MKSLLLFTLVLAGSQSFALTVDCKAENGSRLIATLTPGAGDDKNIMTMSDIQLKQGNSALELKTNVEGTAIIGEELKVKGDSFEATGKLDVSQISVMDMKWNVPLAFIGSMPVSGGFSFTDGSYNSSKATCEISK